VGQRGIDPRVGIETLALSSEFGGDKTDRGQLDGIEPAR